MERPLDTIRSFEAAVEGTYNSRRSTYAGSQGSEGLEIEGSRILRFMQLLKRHSTEPVGEAAILEVCYF